MRATWRRAADLVRRRLGLVALVALTTLGVAALATVLRSPVFEAEADVLISPTPDGQLPALGLGLLTESVDPTRDVETASRLIRTPANASEAARVLGLTDTPEALLDRIVAQPVAQSNIVTVTARAPTAREAVQLANTLTRVAIDRRARSFQAAVDAAIGRLERRAADGPPDDASREELGRQIGALRTLQGADDPNIRVAGAATRALQVAPRSALTLAAGAVIGLALGLLAALASGALGRRRLLDEDHVHELVGLPVLARVAERRRLQRPGSKRAGAAPSAMSAEAMRALQVVLDVPGQRGRTVLVADMSAPEASGEIAKQLATTVARQGARTVLVDGDLSTPVPVTADAGRAYDGSGARNHRGGRELDLLQTSPSDELLTRVKATSGGESPTWVARTLVPDIVDALRGDAEVVVIDARASSEMASLLAWAKHADDVVLVVELRQTPVDELLAAAESLSMCDVTPLGVVLVGAAGAQAQPSIAMAGEHSARRREPRRAVDRGQISRVDIG